MNSIREEAHRLLVEGLGDGAQFREGQLEAIESIVERKERLLLVQRTGWGKSVVYFLATRLLRMQGQGPALLISPLLSLMRDQERLAARFGVRTARVDSSNPEELPAVIEALEGNQCDLLLISPERLANSAFRRDLLPLLSPGIGLFVVDEAHCISDWGHDFRPDYRRIGGVLSALPKGVPVLATTATANDRVIEDIAAQMGEDFRTDRGPLVRTSLRLQAIPLRDQAERFAWLAREIPRLEGSGIIYCLTKRDCSRLADWLQSRGVDAHAYHADVEDRASLESGLLENRVKALVATVALGMGFDKPDLRFVIHYQQPASPVAYYQQVGRAGRGVDKALAVLLGGAEDQRIQAHFIRSAFPALDQIRAIVGAIEESEEGLSIRELETYVNLPQARLKQALRLLLVEGVLDKPDRRYVRTLKRWTPDVDRWERVSARRVTEMERMSEFLHSADCLMEFVARELDDPGAEPCGRCANCAGDLLSREVDRELVAAAADYLGRTDLPIEPKRQWPSGPRLPVRGRIPQEHRAEQGRALSVYGEGELGKVVKTGKYEKRHLPDELVEAAAALVLDQWKPRPEPTWVTCIPSLRHPDLVPNFAERLADRLGLPFGPVLSKTRERPEQKTMENRAHQVHNVIDVLVADGDAVPAGPVLLVDDVVDSGWTLAIGAYRLREAGSGEVFPLALASAGGWR